MEKVKEEMKDGRKTIVVKYTTEEIERMNEDAKKRANWFKKPTK